MSKFMLLVLAALSAGASRGAVLYSVISAAGTSYVCPGDWASAYGNFGAMTARSVVPTGQSLPMVADGVQVSVSGRPAPLSYISTGQINFQVPFETATTGSATFQVSTPSGLTTSVAIAMSPSCLAALPNYNSSGWPLVTNALTGQVVTQYQAQKVGTALTLWVIGGGQTTPLQKTGVVSTGIAWFNNTVSVDCALCTGPVTVQYYGQTPGYVGLGQINFFVPAVRSPGDFLIILSQGTNPLSRIRILLSIVP